MMMADDAIYITRMRGHNPSSGSCKDRAVIDQYLKLLAMIRTESNPFPSISSSSSQFSISSPDGGFPSGRRVHRSNDFPLFFAESMMPAKKTTLPNGLVPDPPMVAGGAGAPHPHQQPELRFMTAWKLYWQNPFRTALELLAERIIRVDGAMEPDNKGGSA